MIDTHAHIRKDDQIKIEGLEAVILSGANIEDSIQNVKLASVNKKLLAAVGVHPQEISDLRWQMSELEKLLKENKNIVAVGECGLEFIEPFDKELQIKFFRAQIDLARKFNKPLIVHARKAIENVFDILSGSQVGGVIHCYTGGKKRVQIVLSLPNVWYFGIDGNLTYEEGLVEVVKTIPRDRLLAETDSPELTPLPFRGQKNVPENVKFVYQKIAEIWEMSFEETEKILDENARRLFQII